jgi:D-beta-D-heptose 7-phosphate kinase/D-beta-D-heptose 1-phosphate adenosyltransferase
VLKSGEVFHIPTEAAKVFDVSGAGDTVVAMLAAALGAKASMLEAMQLANIAAGIVVRKPGTATANLEEIKQALRAKQSGIHQELKVKEWRLLAEQLEEWRAAGLRIGFTNGCFDVLHTGHISLLAQAKAACNRLVVGVNTDASVKRLKGETRPMNGERDRAMVLAALEVVDGVILFGEDTPEQLINKIRPDVLVKGADYTIETVVGAKFVQSYGGKVVLANLKQGYSTTNLIAKMRQG